MLSELPEPLLPQSVRIAGALKRNDTDMKVTSKQVIVIDIENCSGKKELLERIKDQLKSMPETATVRKFYGRGIAISGSRTEDSGSL